MENFLSFSFPGCVVYIDIVAILMSPKGRKTTKGKNKKPLRNEGFLVVKLVDIMSIENLLTKAVECGGKLTVKSALNPILWLCGVVDIPVLAILAILLINGGISLWVLILLFILLFLPVICAIFGIVFLLIKDRGKLQSEDYQIRNRTLDIIEQKGDRFPVLPETVESITNPKTKMIKDGGRK